ncbi:MAG: hypothetical protein F6J99_20525 [Moorea sp. SIO4G3]|nr:hypothetical protein [Moorena sp. SIO4G3]
MQQGNRGFPPLALCMADKASLSYGNLAYGHAKGEREQTMSNCRAFPHSRNNQDGSRGKKIDCSLAFSLCATHTLLEVLSVLAFGPRYLRCFVAQA